MRMSGIVLPALMVIALMATSAAAQVGPAPLITAADGGLTLTRYPMVAKELALTDEQIITLAALRDEYGADVKDEMTQARRAGVTPTRESARKRNDKFKLKVADILDQKQTERISQIHLQQAGFRVYTDSEFAEALGISKEQFDKIGLVNDGFAAKKRVTFGEDGRGGGTEDERMKKLQELETTREKDLEAVLTADQKTLFAKMKGATFDLAKFKADVIQYMNQPGNRPPVPRVKRPGDRASELYRPGNSTTISRTRRLWFLARQSLSPHRGTSTTAQWRRPSPGTGGRLRDR